MREILFRGKRVDNGEWVEGDRVEQNSPDYHDYIITEFAADVDNRHIDILTCDIYEVDPSTVGQYTGLTDKHLKRIFEGDIVEGADFNCEDDGYGIVEWHDGAFEINNGQLTGTFHDNYYGTEFEVIGNIHDNPDLLK